jgi:hypothetical protein
MGHAYYVRPRGSKRALFVAAVVVALSAESLLCDD